MTAAKFIRGFEHQSHGWVLVFPRLLKLKDGGGTNHQLSLFMIETEGVTRFCLFKLRSRRLHASLVVKTVEIKPGCVPLNPQSFHPQTLRVFTPKP